VLVDLQIAEISEAFEWYELLELQLENDSDIECSFGWKVKGIEANMLRNVCGTVMIVSVNFHPSSGECHYTECVMMRGSDSEGQYQNISL
jgi:hypothetical protein